MKRVCILALSNPFAAPYDGGKLDIRARLEALRLIDDVKVDLYIMSKPTDQKTIVNKDEYNIENIYQYEMLPVSISLLWSKYPLSMQRRWSNSMANELSKHHYDVCICEGEYMALYIINDIVKADKLVIRMHNIESNYRRELVRSETSLIHKMAQYLEYLKYLKVEKIIPSLFDNYLFISTDEQKQYIDNYGDNKERFIFMPTAILDHGLDKRDIKRQDILYYGSLDVSNNYLSLKWFIMNVLPNIVKVCSIRLKIIGKISDKRKKELNSLSDNIDVLGYVDNLDKVVQEACFIISPVYYGAGVKVKIIEALSYGQIVVTNSKAIEGTSLKHGKELIVLDNKEDITRACIDILEKRSDYKKMADDGYAYFKKYHSYESQAVILKEIING